MTVVVGNPKPMSRTRHVAEALVAELLTPDAYESTVLELADYADRLFDLSAEDVAAWNRAVAESDLVVFASPTYKATYSGLLKAFLDRYPSNGLAGVVAIPLHTGADAQHSLGANVSLSPLLTELGAVVPGRGLYVPMTQYEELDSVVRELAATYGINIARVAGLADAVSRST
ncbi:NADPH-dependent FMN reductase [Microbacterium atlanticum]|uniref:NADPH-dependent FMN reductase n=1 Tax=Microbacterium atlanticum TaxID=2782168 RepID=UPI001886E48F|nr:NAD(P)H-dependent oxidoreductase [Microbacterium atlanticum]